jgi:hypothetical protein
MQAVAVVERMEWELQVLVVLVAVVQLMVQASVQQEQPIQVAVVAVGQRHSQVVLAVQVL